MDDPEQDDSAERRRPGRGDRRSLDPLPIDDLVPDAPWFWWSTMRNCLPGCCGLDAFDFSAESVRHASGHDVALYPISLGHRQAPGDPIALAAELRSSARRVRELDAKAVSASQFDDTLSPDAMADLFEDLADKLEAAGSAN